MQDLYNIFIWYGYDLRPFLPDKWQAKILQVAHSSARYRELVPTSVTSRESSTDLKVPVHTVGGISVSEQLPWLYDLYTGLFRNLAQRLVDEEVSTAVDKRYGINLNVQHGGQARYECHVDSNPLEGLLYVTDQPPGAGGELIVSNEGDVRGRDEVDANSTRIYPVAGHLIFFDARHHTHYVTPLNDPEGMRVVVAMNFYTPSSPESARPADLNRHLFGSD